MWLPDGGQELPHGLGKPNPNLEARARSAQISGLCPSDSSQGRGFLVPKPGVNRWTLLIDYRYLNPCIKGHEVPLPVFEDLLRGRQATISGPFWIWYLGVAAEFSSGGGGYKGGGGVPPLPLRTLIC